MPLRPARAGRRIGAFARALQPFRGREAAIGDDRIAAGRVQGMSPGAGRTGDEAITALP